MLYYLTCTLNCNTFTQADPESWVLEFSVNPSTYTNVTKEEKNFNALGHSERIGIEERQVVLSVTKFPS